MRPRPHQKSNVESLKVEGPVSSDSKGPSACDLPTSDPTPVAWTIAGSDSGGGAGIQADLKVMNAFGVHGCSVITALTAQNTTGVALAQPVDPDMMKAQLEALAEDLPPAAIKTGMLGSARTCKLLADFLDHFPPAASNFRFQVSSFKFPPSLICDPVLKSTSGSSLLDDDALEILKARIFPHVTVLTPNLPETAFLLGEELPVEDAAKKLLQLGPKSVLIKGGHADGHACRDYWTDGTESMWLSSPRVETKDTHGTGCILSSAIASAIASGQNVRDAVVTAKTFLNQCLHSPSGLGKGHGPMQIMPYAADGTGGPVIVHGIGDPAAVGEAAGLAAVDGIGDPAAVGEAAGLAHSGVAGSAIPPTNAGSAPPPTEAGSAIPPTARPPASSTDPASPMPAATDHSHLRRLSNIFAKDPIYFITTNTKDRRKLFNNPDACNILIEEWTGAFERHGWAIGSYVIMPDHVHFFCKPTPEACKLSRFMQRWKEWSSKRIKRELGIEGTLWQKEFFDHILRSHESYSEKWNYVEQNPVRAGFVENAADWPHSGYIHFK